jgi:hypothetical protein
VDGNGQIGLDFPGTGWTVAQTIPTVSYEYRQYYSFISIKNIHNFINEIKGTFPLFLDSFVNLCAVVKPQSASIPERGGDPTLLGRSSTIQ